MKGLLRVGFRPFGDRPRAARSGHCLRRLQE